MQKGVVLDANDIKRIIAEYFGVDEKYVIKSQYSYTVITEKDNEESKQTERKKL